MTEDKGCKNCDALGIDSEIGVYYCCLSHRQDDLPKEFICDDYTPNKQLKRLEQENKDLKKQIESDKGLITVGGRQQYEITMSYNKCKTALEEINRVVKLAHKVEDYLLGQDYTDLVDRIENKINEVLQ